jgi:tRNA(Ile)-lysidine synthase
MRTSAGKILTGAITFSMLTPRDHVLVALSGGADSVALLVALAEIAPAYDLRLSAAHVHHGLRGAEADRDAAFAERITGEIGRRYSIDIPFYLHTADVKKTAKDNKLSTQEAGRLVRDTWFRALMAEIGAVKVATGHTGSDNAETFLMRLIVGAGPEGLSGIPPVRPPYIRPLVEATRAEVEAFLADREIPWIVDSSNLADDYLRNRVRNRIMPALRDLNPSVERSLMEAAAACREAFAPVRTAAQQFAARHVSDNTAAADEITALDPAVASEVVKIMIFAAAAPRTTPLRLTRAHVRAVLELAAAASRGTKTVKLPGGICARRIYGDLVIGPAPPHPHQRKTASTEMPLAVPGQTPLASLGLMATARIVDAVPGNPDTPAPAAATALLDYDRIDRPIAVRSRRPGDRINLPGDIGTRKLSDILIDAKVPRDKRDRVPILVSGTDIIWVFGRPVDERFAPTGQTRRLLVVTFEQSDG